MSRVLVLEDFDMPQRHAATPSAADTSTIQGPDLEEERLKSYEKGYSAGWEDAAKAFETEQERISADLAVHLHDMSFTYHEAHAALQRDLAEVVRGLVAKVLAPSARYALAEMIEARVAEVAATAVTPVEISVAPENVNRVEKVALASKGPPMRVVPEASLGGGQAFLRFGAAEEKIDLDAVLAEITDAVERHFAETEEADDGYAETAAHPKEARHG